jgi:hypothetical protein
MANSQCIGEGGIAADMSIAVTACSMRAMGGGGRDDPRARKAAPGEGSWSGRGGERAWAWALEEGE